MAYRRRSEEGMGGGWSVHPPETIAIARPSDDLEVRIARANPEGGFVLTILDLALEKGETSSHETIEDAKRLAVTVLRLGLDWK
jgi:hypothetical protein